MSQVEGRNPVLEAVRGRLADRVLVDEGSKSSSRIEEIINLARREGISVEFVSCADRTVAFVLHGDAEKAKPGLKGNLIVNGFQKRTETNREGKTRQYRSFLGPLPAIPYEVVKR